MVEAKIHRALTRKFPYGVFYVAESKSITVLAVFHQARDANRLRKRLKLE